MPVRKMDRDECRQYIRKSQRRETFYLLSLIVVPLLIMILIPSPYNIYAGIVTFIPMIAIVVVLGRRNLDDREKVYAILDTIDEERAEVD